MTLLLNILEFYSSLIYTTLNVCNKLPEVCLFVLLLLNVPVNSKHVGTITSDFVGRLYDIEMNGTTSPAIKVTPQ